MGNKINKDLLLGDQSGYLYMISQHLVNPHPNKSRGRQNEHFY